MKIKIISKGTSVTTKLVNADTLEPIEHVASIEWAVNAGGIAQAVVTFNQVQADVIGETEEVTEDPQKEE